MRNKVVENYDVEGRWWGVGNHFQEMKLTLECFFFFVRLHDSQWKGSWSIAQGFHESLLPWVFANSPRCLNKAFKGKGHRRSEIKNNKNTKTITFTSLSVFSDFFFFTAHFIINFYICTHTPKLKLARRVMGWCVKEIYSAQQRNCRFGLSTVYYMLTACRSLQTERRGHPRLASSDVQVFKQRL